MKTDIKLKDNFKEKNDTVHRFCVDALIITGLVCVTYSLGYLMGRKVTFTNIDSALSNIYRVNPEIKSLTDEALKLLENGK